MISELIDNYGAACAYGDDELVGLARHNLARAIQLQITNSFPDSVADAIYAYAEWCSNRGGTSEDGRKLHATMVRKIQEWATS